MPSDPSGVQPPGVLVRLAPDFFDDSIAVGAGFTFDSTAFNTDYYTISLFNNGNQGQVFKVYAITSLTVSGGGAGVFFVKGTVGSLFAPCASIRPDFQAPFGQIYTQSLIQSSPAVGQNPLITAPLIGFIGDSADSFTNISPFPLFIVPAGYSLVTANMSVGTNAGGSDLRGGTGFWYQVANE